jgi:hypothetical protein
MPTQTSCIDGSLLSRHANSLRAQQAMRNNSHDKTFGMARCNYAHKDLLEGNVRAGLQEYKRNLARPKTIQHFEARSQSCSLTARTDAQSWHGVFQSNATVFIYLSRIQPTSCVEASRAPRGVAKQHGQCLHVLLCALRLITLLRGALTYGAEHRALDHVHALSKARLKRPLTLHHLDHLHPSNPRVLAEVTPTCQQRSRCKRSR